MTGQGAGRGVSGIHVVSGRREAALRMRGSGAGADAGASRAGARVFCWRLAGAGAGEPRAESGAMVEKEEASGGGGISEEEAAQYDRQIRLWGLEAQKR